MHEKRQKASSYQDLYHKLDCSAYFGHHTQEGVRLRNISCLSKVGKRPCKQFSLNSASSCQEDDEIPHSNSCANSGNYWSRSLQRYGVSKIVVPTDVHVIDS